MRISLEPDIVRGEGDKEMPFSRNSPGQCFPMFCLLYPPRHPTGEQGQCSSEHSTHYTYSLHNYWIISIYVENKFPFGTPAQLYWHLVDPLIFKFLCLQRSTSESFLRLRTERSCTWEFPSWPENPKREAFHA